ncbi:hypothetical protein JEZ13_12035 [bacterium]|nr:hypothetical protein [bacterium]
MKNLDLLKLWDKMNNIDTQLKLHRQEHKHLLYYLISITSVGFIVFSPLSPIFNL